MKFQGVYVTFHYWHSTDEGISFAHGFVLGNEEEVLVFSKTRAKTI